MLKKTSLVSAGPTVLLAFLLFPGIVCQGSVEITARCPDICVPSVEQAFRECARFLTIGCVLQPCDGGFGCPLPNPIDPDIEVRPGGEVVITGLNVLDRFKFQVNLNTSSPVQTDIYLLSDATGSIERAIEVIKMRFTEIIELFEEGTTNAHFGIGFYRDEETAGLDNGFANLQGITGDRSAVLAAVQSLTAIGGGDADEANLVALHKIATDAGIGWRTGSRRLLIYFGDNPGHEPSCVEGKTITRSQVITDLNELNITVIAASFSPGLDRAPVSFGCPSGTRGAGPRQGTDISTETDGILVPDTEQAQIIEAIENAVRGLDRTFDLDSSDCDGKLTSSTNPSLPVTLGPDESQVIDQIVTIEAGVCDGGNTFECVLGYTESGARLEPTVVRLLDIQGCPDLL